MSYIFEVEGLESLQMSLRTMPQVTKKAAKLAINTVAQRSGMTLIKRTMESEIDFPSGYLNGDRLKVTKLANENNLEAVIEGRKRATSLARFAAGSAINGKAGVTVKVKKGRSTFLKRAWLVKLRKGASMTEDQYNVGLAVRVNAGERIVDKRTTHQSWLVPGKVALLYGPSVDQVFRSVADETTPEIAQLLNNEFTRQFLRLSE